VIRAKCQQAVVVLIGLSLLAWTGLAAAAPTSFQVPLSGAEQVPSVKTAGTGTADLTWDPSTRSHLARYLSGYVKPGHDGAFPSRCARPQRAGGDLAHQ